MSSIRCPHCNFALVLKGVRPGRFTPKCSRCEKKFTLVVPEDATKEPTVAVINEEPKPTAATVPPPAASAINKTAPPPATPTAAPRPARSPSVAVAPSTPVESDITGSLGGYEIIKRIGRGGMGSVYLARQVSLDRNVAVKVLSRQWAHDPQFVARFTREAYAAAQLVHHNVVQIHDIGAQDDTHYFSMEFVDGQNLAGAVSSAGKLDPEVAAGYALQAARALKFAHDHGMIHRDVKPENLLLNAQGIVKLADLGLVKTPGTKDPAARGLASSSSTSPTTTLADSTMGTPAYIAPEQATDAAKVDARADIYSLGCTLYDLVTGQPPFSGKTVMEVITKHASEPVTPPERVASRVPPVLSKIIQKMMAKKPEDRYQNADEVVKALEGFLGLDSSGPFTPREEHANVLESDVETFNTAPKAKLRRWVVRGFYAICAVLVVALAATNHPLWSGGFLGLALLTTLSYIIVTGVTQKTLLFLRLRQWFFGASIGDWAMRALAVALGVVVIYCFHLLWVWLAFCAVAVGLAVGLHATLDLLAWRERRGYVEDVEKMLKGMRLRGLEEDSLRQFVCKYGGERWEEFYEAMFGYEAKIDARQRWGRSDRGKPRKKHGAWRDPIVRWLDQKIQARQELKEKKMLQAVEEKELKAQGLDEAAAKSKAKDRAEAMVDKAAEFKQVAASRANETIAPGQVLTRPRMSASFLTETDDGAAHRDRARKLASRRGPLGAPGILLGTPARFVLAAALLAACFLWLQQNELLSWPPKLGGQTQPLAIPMVPAALTGHLFNSLAVGVAGLILLLSLFWRGLGMGLVVILAAVIIVAGPVLLPHLDVPSLAGMNPAQTSLAAGGLLAVLGFAFAKA